MKNKYNLMKFLLAASVLVVAGLIYSCTVKKDAKNDKLVDLAGRGEGSGRNTSSDEEDGPEKSVNAAGSVAASDVAGTTPGPAANRPGNVSGESGDGVSSPASDNANQVSICVHICGAVKKPGVYYVEEDTRIHKVVELAGGLTEDAAGEYVNLAMGISDGQQIYIPTREEADSGNVRMTSTEPETEDGLVNINTASLSQLMLLPGIGQSKAEAIITYRENVASFDVPEDIMKVAGIKDAAYDKLKDYIKV
ncbi:MAG: helix-hairpin-helix domain-containing protein [Lachnospiraceae bacterium]|jgi:competence protein ComEA